MSVADTLRAARAKVAQGWTRQTLARDARGCVTIPTSVGAASWCVAGAICSLDVTYAEDEAAMRALEREISRCSIISWNDRKGRTQAEVLALFDRAIAAAESEGA